MRYKHSAPPDIRSIGAWLAPNHLWCRPYIWAHIRLCNQVVTVHELGQAGVLNLCTSITVQEHCSTEACMLSACSLLARCSNSFCADLVAVILTGKVSSGTTFAEHMCSQAAHLWMAEGRGGLCHLCAASVSPVPQQGQRLMSAPGSRFVPSHELHSGARCILWRAKDRQTRSHGGVQHTAHCREHGASCPRSCFRSTHGLYHRKLADSGPCNASARLPRSNRGKAMYRPLSGFGIGAVPVHWYGPPHTMYTSFTELRMMNKTACAQAHRAASQCGDCCTAFCAPLAAQAPDSLRPSAHNESRAAQLGARHPAAP